MSTYLSASGGSWHLIAGQPTISTINKLIEGLEWQINSQDIILFLSAWLAYSILELRLDCFSLRACQWLLCWREICSCKQSSKSARAVRCSSHPLSLWGPICKVRQFKKKGKDWGGDKCNKDSWKALMLKSSPTIHISKKNRMRIKAVVKRTVWTRKSTFS